MPHPVVFPRTRLVGAALLLALATGALEAQVITSSCAGAAGTGPHDVVICDLDGVNGFDAVASFEYSDTVVSFLNDGTGILVTSTTSTFAGSAPRGLVAADFDGTGTVDIAVACPELGVVKVLYGAGTGAWTTTTTIATGGFPVDVGVANIPAAAGPLNLVVADQGSFFTPGRVLVYPNDARTTPGAQTFGAPTVLASGGSYVSVAGGDVTGGSGIDLVAADSSTAPNGGVLVFDSATGAQIAGSPLLAGTAVSHVSLHALNGDAKLDVIWTSASFITGGQVGILETPGFSNFTPAAVPAIDAAGGSFDGDSGGLPDIVYVTATGQLRRLRNYHGGGSFDADELLVASSAFAVAAGQLASVGGAGNPGCQSEEIVVAYKATDTVCSHRFRVLSSTTWIAGSGCPGSPIVSATSGGAPTLGNPTFAITVSGGTASAFAVLFVQLNLPHGSAPVLYPLSGCAHVLDVTQPWIEFLAFYSTALGGAEVRIPVPADPVLLCLEFRAQWAIFDGLGPIAGISISNALLMRVGEY